MFRVLKRANFDKTPEFDLDDVAVREGRCLSALRT